MPYCPRTRPLDCLDDETKTNPNIWKKIEEDYNEIVEDLRTAIVIVGGREFSPKEIEELSLQELLIITLNNGINLKVSLKEL
jgi:hypothetical protein